MLSLAGLAGAALLATSLQDPGAGFQAPLLNSPVRASAGYSSSASGASYSAPQRAGAPTPGQVHIGNDRTATLVDEFNAALRRHPSDPTGLGQLADGLLTRRPAAGADAYARLVESYPDEARSWTGLARARLALGDTAGAGRAVARALELDPRQAGAHLLQGRVLAGSVPTRMAAALSEWKKAIELAPGSEAALEAQKLVRLYEGK